VLLPIAEMMFLCQLVSILSVGCTIWYREQAFSFFRFPAGAGEGFQAWGGPGARNLRIGPTFLMTCRKRRLKWGSADGHKTASILREDHPHIVRAAITRKAAT